MKRILGVLLAISLCLTLPACDFVVTDTEGLLERPTLNARQAAVYRALADSLGSGEILYRRPQRGLYRSSFLFYDMDGDGSDEAVVFYAIESESGTTRAKFLREDENGLWEVVSDLPAQSEQIDFVQFPKLLTTEASCMLIGWQSPLSQISRVSESFLGVYSYADGKLTTEIDRQYYDEFTVVDLDGNDLDDVVTVGREDGARYSVSLIRSVGLNIDRTDTLPLSSGADDILRLSTGSLGNGYDAVYIDEQHSYILDDGEEQLRYATEVMQVDRTGMTFLAGDVPSAEAEEPLPALANYEFTFRDERLLSEDIDGDGEIEIPARLSELPGASGDLSRAPVYLTDYLIITRGDLDTKYRAVANTDEGYLLKYPEIWQESVAVYEPDGPDEWRFFVVDDSGRPTTELLRILAYSASTAAESDPDEIALGSRGTRHFTGYIPNTVNESAAITEEELREMFLLPGN
jgi:hypothetical protein